ncbi:hypothetical protein [Kosakonia radicincitans]
MAAAGHAVSSPITSILTAASDWLSTDARVRALA